jgi:tetratricopeptide (TPR) repeat protein
MEKIKQGRHAYFADSTLTRIQRSEMMAWVAFAENNPAEALKRMREAADLQDKVGQGEVDIPAREMLADILLELGRAQDALPEYKKALTLSPNRFNGLFNAGKAAEEVGDAPLAQQYYAALLKVTDNGSQSRRPEFDHIKRVVSSAKLAVK